MKNKEKIKKTYRRIISVLNWKIIIFLFLLYAIFGSMLIMKLNFIDACYFSTITIATVGFGDITPTTDIQKIFTISLAFAGMGLITYVITTILTNISKELLLLSKGAGKMKKIDKMDEYYIIYGYGRVGKSVADNLLERHQNVVIVENNEEISSKIKESKHVVVLNKDAREHEVQLKLINEKCNGAIITTSDDVTNIFILLNIRELDKNIQVISRLSDLNNKNKFKTAGANKIISPEIRGGEDMFYSAIQTQMIRITSVNRSSEIIDKAQSLEIENCRLECIDYHIPGIKTPLSHQIKIGSGENFKNIKKLYDNLEYKEDLEKLYARGRYIHSLWITCPNKEYANKIIKKIENNEGILGINLTDEEIAKISKKYISKDYLKKIVEEIDQN